MMKRIQAQHISKQYGKGDAAVSALKEVSFTIDAGEFVAVMGESGSGKSTLLSIVGTLNSPTSGRLMVDDVDVYALGKDERADFRRESIGFVFQNFNLIPYLTLAENVMLPLATVREKRAKKRSMALEALRRVGLSAKGGAPPQPDFRGASRSGWPLPGRSSAGRRSSWPMSRPAISTRRRGRRSWGSSTP